MTRLVFLRLSENLHCICRYFDEGDWVHSKAEKKV